MGILDYYEFHLPRGHIAQTPAARREQARMMRLGRRDGSLAHEYITDLGRALRPGDLLVMNDAKVVPARLRAIKPSGGRLEVFLLSPAQPETIAADGREGHLVLLKGRAGAARELFLENEPGVRLEIIEKREKGLALVYTSMPAMEMARQYGQTPLPPYIKRQPNPDDRLRYQTVYARVPGAVAAPTAGLHLTESLLRRLRAQGVDLGFITLHVGYGTFAEPAPKELAAGRLHREWVEAPAALARQYQVCRARGGRVVAVGTTSARALEWAATEDGLRPGAGWCQLLIAPGYQFRAIDGLLTNFHLPRTTLLMLAAAFAGWENIMRAYQEAVRLRYRFYSFGDAMLIL
jgi:S-adenosylmethionine:tRNA ribosyltransferase-isomerase